MDKKINGLTNEEVINNRRKYGSNKIPTKKKESFFRKLLETLGDPIIKILLIALGIKTVFLIKDFDWYETIGIVIAIFLASFISTISELGSEQAFNRLQEESSKIKSKVIRNGKIELIDIDDIVVDDLVILESGDKVPADGIIIDGKVSVDESSLNGESKEIHKSSYYKDDNRLYRGTVIMNDRSIMKVTSVGSNTFYGKLAIEVQEKSPDSPMKIRLKELAKLISRIGYIGAALAFFSYMFKIFVINNNFDIELIKKSLMDLPYLSSHILHGFTLCVTIIVVAVPEGLPMMITLVLSSNMKKMLKSNVLVRKMVGIETSGSINILFTDKTGTLTKGKLDVNSILTGNLENINSLEELKRHPKYHDLVKVSIVVNNESNIDVNNEIVGGNSTDKALLRFMKEKVSNIIILDKVPFNSKNKYSSTKVIYKGETLNLVKGAFENLISECTKYYDLNGNIKTIYSKGKIYSKIMEYTKRGIRVLALIIRRNNESILLGIVLIKDEIREEAREAIKLIRDANIQVVMLTGDNLDTAKSIAIESGLINSSEDIAINSYELNNLSDLEIGAMLPKIKVIARSLPQDKSRLIKIAQSLNLVVGMTGDGVNDAPALKKADVGFSMGSGTEVAKEASDIVILDDNILSITKAILFGRTIFKSIRKFIIFQLTVNLCALTLSIIGPLIGIASPVTVIQMLWINMVMDTLAGLAFAYEPPLIEYMKERPKKKDEKIINKYMLNEILVTGAFSSILCLIFLKSTYFYNLFRSSTNDLYFMSAFFGLFIFMGIFNSFNARTHRLHLFAHILKNKVFIVIIAFIVIVQIILIYYGGSLFRTTPLNTKELLVVIAIAFSVIPIDFIRKVILRLKGIKGGV